MIIIDTALNTLKNVIVALICAPLALFIFLAYFQPELLNEYVPTATIHIREAIDMSMNFIHNLINKIV